MFGDLGHLATFPTEQQSCRLTCLEDCCLASLCLEEVCPEELDPAEVVTVESHCWTCFPLEEAASAAEIRWDMIESMKCWLRSQKVGKSLKKARWRWGRTNKELDAGFYTLWREGKIHSGHK